MLLKLAGEDGHALQEQALEAIGHLGRSPRADEVFKILERHAKFNTTTGSHALIGLRWLGTAGRLADHPGARGRPDVSRSASRSSNCWATTTIRRPATCCSGCWPRPTTMVLLIGADRRPAALRPRLPRAGLRGACRTPTWSTAGTTTTEILDRVLDRGEPRRIFEILPKCADEVRDALTDVLLNRPEPPVAEALAALDSPDADHGRGGGPRPGPGRRGRPAPGRRWRRP